MFKKQLEDDCRRIFGYKKIIYGDVDQGIEQDVLYISIEDVSEVVLAGKIKFLVRMKLAMLGTEPSTKYGFFYNRLKQAFKKDELKLAANRFLLYDKEKNIKFSNYEDFFVQTEVNCLYKVSVDYDPSAKTKGFITKIKEFFKK
uniref:Uncharacterized protein n=1 Tax=Dulem virus 29 TaxID=3145747 RepID=A0AAU8AV55_9CAUD